MSNTEGISRSMRRYGRTLQTPDAPGRFATALQIGFWADDVEELERRSVVAVDERSLSREGHDITANALQEAMRRIQKASEMISKLNPYDHGIALGAEISNIIKVLQGERDD